MSLATLALNGKHFVVIEQAEYRRLRQAASQARSLRTAPYPEPDADGLVPAIAFANADIARKLARRRKQAALTQAELAKRAGLRVETISRIENGRNVPDTATVQRIDRALRKAAK
jgi:DNA-binding XRE family transcriptional regulator